ncbi:succinyl-diaminopimelate desuccinylase [Hamadaea flava]|uniref:Succinyl-diaminopimelate desuccinylase n=1 Tax=Hamadaea flava TaxID=1742688 RepID=A0ABV8LJG3_9ACTN|nr:succinyl-diaminopimelate desuccinylase [Hamadaea flava]MCP2325388.1 succinyl-diaminopimelate desuccinylase [Hamadaea flava]
MADVLTSEVLADPVALTRALVDIESVSGNEKEIADAVEAALRTCAHLTVERVGHTVVARTQLGRSSRVVLAGHLDTVPIAGNFPSHPSMTAEGVELMWGCGTSDMKSGTAIALHLAITVTEPKFDVTYLFYEAEEVEAVRNGLFILSQQRPELLAADFAILLEPTYGVVEAGCQGTMRVIVSSEGKRAHSARSWLGVNAIHAAGEILARLSAYRAREVEIDGCLYREGLNAVAITGGVAGNVVPDRCEIEVNYRFAPSRSVNEALEHLVDVFHGFDVKLTDSAPGALPGLTLPPAAAFIAATGTTPAAKLGWTDVARFSALGVPALNFGPGDPNLAHKVDEHVEIVKIVESATTLRTWLSR